MLIKGVDGGKCTREREGRKGAFFAAIEGQNIWPEGGFGSGTFRLNMNTSFAPLSPHFLFPLFVRIQHLLSYGPLITWRITWREEREKHDCSLFTWNWKRAIVFLCVLLDSHSLLHPLYKYSNNHVDCSSLSPSSSSSSSCGPVPRHDQLSIRETTFRFRFLTSAWQWWLFFLPSISRSSSSLLPISFLIIWTGAENEEGEKG